ncbi:MAG: type II toxin-antitoxin system VapC family toxin [Pyrinomonadaceae bacterium]
MAVVVDTNILSYLFKRDTRVQLYESHLKGVTRLISFMTLAELYNWTLQNNWGSRRKEELEKYISGNYGVIYSDEELCKIWANIKSDAHKYGNPIDTADAWVAAVALLFDVPLVTHNRRHFENISNLQVISEG